MPSSNLGGSGDLGNQVIGTLAGITSNYRYSCPMYNPIVAKSHDPVRRGFDVCDCRNNLPRGLEPFLHPVCSGLKVLEPVESPSEAVRYQGLIESA